MNGPLVTLAIGYKENIIKKTPENRMFSKSQFENLRSDKYFIYEYCPQHDGTCYYMHIYESQSLQLLQIIPFIDVISTNTDTVRVSVSPSTIAVVFIRHDKHQVKLKLLE